MSSSQCWSCGAARAAADALCPTCGKVQPPAALAPGASPLDRFALLGLPRTFDLDPSQLEEKFRALSRKLHPDRFARASAQERRFSLEQTTQLNDAVRTLRDPVRRAGHLLALRGVQVAGAETGPRVPGQPPPRDPPMAPEFLEEALEDRERLLEVKEQTGPGAAPALEALAAEARAKHQATLTEVANLLRALETGQAGRDPEATGTRAADLLARLRYTARYLDEVEGRPPEM